MTAREIERAHQRRLLGAIAETAAFAAAVGGAAVLVFWATTSDVFVPDTFYETCDEARMAGVAPLTAHDAGYRAALDRNGDGVACETFEF